MPDLSAAGSDGFARPHAANLQRKGGFGERREVGRHLQGKGTVLSPPQVGEGLPPGWDPPRCLGRAVHVCRSRAAARLLRLSLQRAPACWRTARAASCARRTTAASPATTGSSCSSGGTASASTACASTPAPPATSGCEGWRSTDAQVRPVTARAPPSSSQCPHVPSPPRRGKGDGCVSRSIPGGAEPGAAARAGGGRAVGLLPLFPCPELQPGPCGFAKGLWVPGGHRGYQLRARHVPALGLAQLTSPPSRQSAGRPAARAASAETSA